MNENYDGSVRGVFFFLSDLLDALIYFPLR